MCLPKVLIQILNQFDQAIDQELEEAFQRVSEKSKALAKSLKRSFIQARLSNRFLAIYQQANQNPRESTEDLIKKINQEFEEVDFLVFREFARLLRACSLHIDFQVSAKIKENFKKTFRTERLKLIIDFVAESQV